MTREQLIKFGNKFIERKLTDKEALKEIIEFCMKDSKKGSFAVSIYKQLPWNVKERLIQAMINIYCKKLSVNSLWRIKDNTLQLIAYV
jgi:hypothetical protein